MFVPYCTIFVDNKDVEVVHSPLDSLGRTLVRIEIPDDSCGFKVLECYLPSYEIKTNYKLGDVEYFFYMDFIRNNSSALLEYAKYGGVAKLVKYEKRNSLCVKLCIFSLCSLIGLGFIKLMRIRSQVV